MAENWKELVLEIAGEALGLRFLSDLTGVNLRKTGKDHNTEKQAWGRPEVGRVSSWASGQAEPLVLLTRVLETGLES